MEWLVGGGACDWNPEVVGSESESEVVGASVASALVELLLRAMFVESVGRASWGALFVRVGEEGLGKVVDDGEEEEGKDPWGWRIEVLLVGRGGGWGRGDLGGGGRCCCCWSGVEEVFVGVVLLFPPLLVLIVSSSSLSSGTVVTVVPLLEGACRCLRAVAAPASACDWVSASPEELERFNIPPGGGCDADATAAACDCCEAMDPSWPSSPSASGGIV